MILDRFVVGRLQANCYVVGDEESRQVLVVDPGDQAPALAEEIRGREYLPIAIFVTHAHLDHSGGAHDLLEAFPEAEFWMHEADYRDIEGQNETATTWYGHPVTVPHAPDRALAHGDALEVDALRFTALHTPGHTVGSICLGGEGIVFTGDVLFHGTVGRSDLPGGDGPMLIRSIHEQLLTMADDTIVLPGHGPQTTIAVKRVQNPFLMRHT